MDQFLGQWVLEKNEETYDTYLKTIGASHFSRKSGELNNPYLYVRRDGSYIKVVEASSFRKIPLRFELNKEFNEVTSDGRKYKAVWKIEDGKLVHYRKALNQSLPDTKTTIHIQDDDEKLISLLEIVGDDKLKVQQIYRRYLNRLNIGDSWKSLTKLCNQQNNNH